MVSSNYERQFVRNEHLADTFLLLAGLESVYSLLARLESTHSLNKGMNEIWGYVLAVL